MRPPTPTRLLRVIRRIARGAARPVDPAAILAAHRAETRDRLLAEANLARDAGRSDAAAALYGQVVALEPERGDILIQLGHMLKEAGQLPDARTAYLQAKALRPDDADLALQLGHFYKVAGDGPSARDAYREAARLQPGWDPPLRELDTLGADVEPSLVDLADAEGAAEGLVPELFPRAAAARLRRWVQGVRVHRLGARRERTPWGVLPTLRGVEAIRGYCVSARPATTLAVEVDGREVHREPLVDTGPGAGGSEHKYVFNSWIDFADIARGPCAVRLRILDAAGDEVASVQQQAAVLEPLTEAQHPGSDAVVDIDRSGALDVTAQVNARPSMVRPAARIPLGGPPRAIAVLRTDQLGDIVTSAPAAKRLRELFPQAKLVGLFTAANADFAHTLGIFDEIVVVDFPDDAAERRRIMDASSQARLKARLAPYRFDVALDLAESAVSRPLLLLTGARFTYGFHDRDWPWLTGGFDGATHDVRTYTEVAAQSTKVLALVERLGATFHSRAELLPRPELSHKRLARFGLHARDRYAVLHTGARIAFSRWSGYPHLARLILANTDLKVVLMGDETALRDRLPEELQASERFQLLDGRLAFDDFDALLSLAAVFVGNDSGPKHLAAVRGTPVVSVHSSRIGWSEWGQELSGVIVSRRVPCAGCHIFHDEDECGKSFACIRLITPEEVWMEVATLLQLTEI